MAKPDAGSRGYRRGRPPDDPRQGPGWNPNPAGPPTRAVAQPGNLRAVTHGIYSELALAPRTVELADWLRANVPNATEADEPMIQAAAMALARLESAQRHLDQTGMVTRRGQLRPLMRVIGTLQAEARRSLEALSLTPATRTRLGLDSARGFDLARRLAALDDEEAEGG
jgi:Phage terminase, small subunit